MLNSLSNNAIIGKVRSMYGKRVSESDYDEMLRRSSVIEIAVYLKQLPAYSNTLSEINESEIHRGQLENLLHRNIFYIYEKLCRYDFSNKSSINNIIMSFEISEILRCITLINNGNGNKFIMDLPGFLISRANFNVLAFADVRSFDGLLDILSGTGYDNILKSFRTDGEINRTGCETALYTYYYNRTAEYIKNNFSGSAKTEMTVMYMIEAELSNITAAWRLIKLFGYDGRQIKPYIYPFYYKISKKRWEEIFAARSFDEFEKALEKTVYYKLFHGSDSDFVEDAGYRMTNRDAKRILRFSTNAVSVMHAYISLQRIELKNIFNIIEGIRYRVNPEEIKKFLVI